MRLESHLELEAHMTTHFLLHSESTCPMSSSDLTPVSQSPSLSPPASPSAAPPPSPPASPKPEETEAQYDDPLQRLGPPERWSADTLPLITPIGASVAYYNKVQVLNAVIGRALGGHVEPVDNGSSDGGSLFLVKGVYNLCHRFNERLRQSLLSTSPDQRRLAYNCFSHGLPHGNMNRDWLHGALQCLVLDRIIFGVSEKPAKDLRPLQKPLFKETHAGFSEDLSDYFFLHIKWTNTLDRFGDAWRKGHGIMLLEAKQPTPLITHDIGPEEKVPTSDGQEMIRREQGEVTSTGVTPGQSEVLGLDASDASKQSRNGAAMTDLLKRIRTAERNAGLMNVYYNFCSAALGLRALVMVSHTRPSSGN